MKDEPGYDPLKAMKKELGTESLLVHDDVLSRIPTKHESLLLSIPRSAPVQEVRRTNRAPDGTILMHHRLVLVGPLSLLGYDYEVHQ